MNYYNEINQNTNTNPYQKLIQTLHTTGDISLLSKEIEQLQQTLYQTSEAFQQTLNTQIRDSTAQIIQTILTGIQPETSHPQPNQTAKALEDILAFIRSLPIIHLTLATEPSTHFLTEISTFIRKDIVPNAILQLTLDPQILGGLILDYQGKYYNYSLKKQLST